MKSRLSILITSLLLSLFLFAVTAFLQWEDWFSKSDVETVEGQPDMVAHTLEQWSFNEDGAKQYQLLADTMQQFVNQNRNLMNKPSVLFFEGITPSWKTRANQAVSDATNHTLHLSGQVVIEQKSVDEPATLETDTLVLYPKTYHASTEDQVIIRRTGVYIEAIGLDADFNANKITLRTNVTSIYEPDKL